MSRVVEYKRNRAQESIAQKVVFVIFTIVLVFCIAFCITGTVQSQREGISVDEQHLLVMEKEYVKSIRSYLKEQGFENSGVNLTKVIEMDGSRSYSVQVHHEKLDELSEAEQELLFQNVKDMAFEIEGCSFQVGTL